MHTIYLDKIPSVFKNVNLCSPVHVTKKNFEAEEGALLVVEVQNSEGKRAVIESIHGRLGTLNEGEVIPVVLGYRKALVEFAGIIPHLIADGDQLFLLGESGVVGQISGFFPDWGEPLAVKVLGGIIDEQGQLITLSHFALPVIPEQPPHAPIVAFIGTRMDCGKTTMACKVIHAFKKQGKKIAAGKLTGFSYAGDLHRFRDCGANPVLDFVDMGMPSTCNGQPERVLASASNLLNHLKLSQPDLIVLEFGDSLLGEYHVAEILQKLSFKQMIDIVVLAAYDFCGIKGAQSILNELGLSIDLITGPVVNSQIGVELVQKYFSLLAKSNQGEILALVNLIESKWSDKNTELTH